MPLTKGEAGVVAPASGCGLVPLTVVARGAGHSRSVDPAVWRPSCLAGI